MPGIKKARSRLLKLMYAVAILVAGGFGIGLLIKPELTEWIFGAACPDIVSGLVGSVFIAFALLSVLGLRSPVKFAPVLMFHLIYKLTWLLAVILPRFFGRRGRSRDYAGGRRLYRGRHRRLYSHTFFRHLRTRVKIGMNPLPAYKKQAAV